MTRVRELIEIARCLGFSVALRAAFWRTPRSFWTTGPGDALLEATARYRRDPHALKILVLLRWREPGPGPRWDVEDLRRHGFDVGNAEAVLRHLTAEGCNILGTRPVRGSLGLRTIDIKGLTAKGQELLNSLLA